MGLKPMNCPAHCLIFGSVTRSYRVLAFTTLYTTLYTTVYMCPRTTKCVRTLLHMCPYFRVGHEGRIGSLPLPHSILLYICVLVLLCVCPHTTIYVCVLAFTTLYATTICVLVLLYMCPHTTMCVSSPLPHSMYVSSYCCICVANYYICVLVLVLILLNMCPHTTVYVPSYYYMSVCILLCKCPHTIMYLSTYYCMCPHTIVCGPSPHTIVYCCIHVRIVLYVSST
jgi:hypothetical protein